MIWTYLRRVIAFAFSRLGIKIELANGLVSIAVSFFLGSRAKPMGDLTTHDVAWIAVAFIAVWIALRLLGGTYWVWRESEVALQSANNRLQAPERKIAESMADYRAGRLADLAKTVSEILVDLGSGGLPDEIRERGRRFASIRHEFSYDALLLAKINAFGNTIETNRDDAAKQATEDRGRELLAHLHSIGAK